MRRAFGVALLLQALLASTAWAQQCTFFPPIRIEAGANVYFRVQNSGYGPRQLGPWYHYWPLEAHFQTPALPEYPYWPRPQTLPNGSGAVPPVNTGQGVNPAGYHAPGHWYGR